MSELPKGFVTASHAVLFQEPEANRCDVCGATLDGEGETSRGLLVWSRGEERRYTEPPLCQTCATAVGVTALHRWEIEEDEG